MAEAHPEIQTAEAEGKEGKKKKSSVTAKES